MTSYRTSSGGTRPGEGAWSQMPEDVPAEQRVPPPSGPWQPASAPGTAGPQPGTAGQPEPPNTAGQAPAEPVTPPGGQAPPRHHVIKRTRIGGAWVAAALFALVLLFLLIFILENGNKVEISYLGLHGHLPLGVALLLAAVLGVVLVVIPGTGRILQLRATARRHRLMDARAQDAAAGQTGNGQTVGTPSVEAPPRSS
jgi:lipopolysaccharide assembly protein A